MNLERSYLARFEAPAFKQARGQAAYAVINDLPRHLLEVIAFGGMILFVLRSPHLVARAAIDHGDVLGPQQPCLHGGIDVFGGMDIFRDISWR